MVAPLLSPHTQNILDEVHQNVAPHILAMLHMDDVNQVSSIYRGSLMFRNVWFMHEETWCRGIIAVYQRFVGGKFDVFIEPDGKKLYRMNNLTGAKLEDLFISLADI